jgi:hypothetical protein
MAGFALASVIAHEYRSKKMVPVIAYQPVDKVLETC